MYVYIYTLHICICVYTYTHVYTWTCKIERAYASLYMCIYVSHRLRHEAAPACFFKICWPNTILHCRASLVLVFWGSENISWHRQWSKSKPLSSLRF